MSHFTVGVFLKEGGKTLEEMLAPYQENNMGDCPKEYLEFNECSEDDIKEYENYKGDYSSLDEFMYEYHGYKKDDKTGKYGYWENPNAMWDWYAVGGRWENYILKKDGTRRNYAKLKEIDWNTMKENFIKEAAKVWDSNPKGIERYLNGITLNDTRESYIKRLSEFTTHAVITQDGKWNSKGKMGCFGISSETEEEKNNWSDDFYDTFIKGSDEELTLVIVDCHI